MFCKKIVRFIPQSYATWLHPNNISPNKYPHKLFLICSSLVLCVISPLKMFRLWQTMQARLSEAGLREKKANTYV